MGALMSEGLRQMRSSAAPSDYLAVQARWSHAQEASDRRQQQQLAEVDEEGMAEAAQLVGATNVTDMVRHALPTATDSSADNDFLSLLQQLEREPKTDEELMAKFTLYETYSRQVELVR